VYTRVILLKVSKDSWKKGAPFLRWTDTLYSYLLSTQNIFLTFQKAIHNFPINTCSKSKLSTFVYSFSSSPLSLFLCLSFPFKSLLCLCHLSLCAFHILSYLGVAFFLSVMGKPVLYFPISSTQLRSKTLRKPQKIWLTPSKQHHRWKLASSHTTLHQGGRGGGREEASKEREWRTGVVLCSSTLLLSPNVHIWSKQVEINRQTKKKKKTRVVARDK
jgi:hypothetical protein